MLRDGIPDPPTPSQRQQVERIGASAKHLLALIDEVLTLSRLELGRERITPTAVVVGTLVEEAAAMMEPEARKKGLALSFAVPEERIAMVTDAGKLRQALVNLLGNAVKFTDSGGVCIRARAEPDGDEVVFEVEDTGIGISAEHLPRVFDAFWQVDQAPTRRVGGTGLGLHVTRRLARLLGGDVSARSVVGEGSCFTIRVSRAWWGATEEAHDVERETTARSRGGDSNREYRVLKWATATEVPGTGVAGTQYQLDAPGMRVGPSAGRR